MLCSHPPGIPVFSLGFPPAPAPSWRVRASPPPARPRGGCWGLLLDWKGIWCFFLSTLPTPWSSQPHWKHMCPGWGGWAGAMLHLSHGMGDRQLWVPWVLAPMGSGVPALVSNGAAQGQQGCCPFGGVMRDPCWSPPTMGIPPSWAARGTSPEGAPCAQSQGLGRACIGQEERIKACEKG